ncbi:MAG: hypothetical protein QXR84_06520 [Candidatus Bathyarchaeia archaeon]|nr:hypothetical protein [Candidatus Bathyarchaeota archaeon]
MEDELVIGGVRLGQVRIIEAVIASILVFMAFTAVFFMLFSSEKFFKQEAVDLNRLAYNVLSRLVEPKVIEDSIEDSWVNETKIINALQNLLPQNIYFNLTVSKWVSEPGGIGRWVTISSSISNAPEDLFKASTEVASASIVYTSKNGKIYRLCLSLTRAELKSIFLVQKDYML